MNLQTGSERVFTRVIAEIDFSRDGKQVGRLLLPRSHDDSAWGAVAVPVEAGVLAVRIRRARRLAAGIRERRHSGSMREEVRRWIGRRPGSR